MFVPLPFPFPDSITFSRPFHSTSANKNTPQSSNKRSLHPNALSLAPPNHRLRRRRFKLAQATSSTRGNGLPLPQTTSTSTTSPGWSTCRRRRVGPGGCRRSDPNGEEVLVEQFQNVCFLEEGSCGSKMLTLKGESMKSVLP